MLCMRRRGKKEGRMEEGCGSEEAGKREAGTWPYLTFFRGRTKPLARPEDPGKAHVGPVSPSEQGGIAPLTFSLFSPASQFGGFLALCV